MFKSAFCIKELYQDLFGNIVHIWKITDSSVAPFEVKAPHISNNSKYLSGMGGLVAVWYGYRNRNPAFQFGRYLALRAICKSQAIHSIAIQQEILKSAKMASRDYIDWDKYESCITRAFAMSLLIT